MKGSPHRHIAATQYINPLGRKRQFEVKFVYGCSSVESTTITLVILRLTGVRQAMGASDLSRSEPALSHMPPENLCLYDNDMLKKK